MATNLLCCRENELGVFIEGANQKVAQVVVATAKKLAPIYYRMMPKKKPSFPDSFFFI